MKHFLNSFLLILAFHYAQPQDNLKTWEVFEITFTGRNTYGNAYVEGLPEGGDPYLQAVFSGRSGEAAGKSYLIPGFWDGENQWRIRFAPPFTGEWAFITSSPDRRMNNKKGSLNVTAWTEEDKSENPCRRGVIQVADSGMREGRYFTYFDGTPFLWIGDTWWNWTKEEIRFDSFKKLADTRAAQHFTIGQLFFAANGWGEESSLLDSDTWEHPDIAHIHHVEEMIRYANSKGITVWIHTWWSRENIDEMIGGENIRRWWRYVVHRLQAYNVVWVLAGEYNMYDYGGFDLKFWNSLGRMIKEEDPFDRITSAHPTPPAWGGGAGAPQWSTAEVIHQEDWLDYNQSQPGHGKWRNEMIPEIVRFAYQQEPAKPIVVTEPWYEFVEGNPSARDIRFGAWSAMLSGAAGHSYAGGHVWRAHLPESPEGAASWPMDTSFSENTLDYAGAESMSFLSEFLHSLAWWKLEPHPEFVIENPSRYCAADPGNEYLVYLRYGGHARIDLRDAPGKNMHYRWIDLTTQQAVREGEIRGGEISGFPPPEDYPGALHYKDWLLHIFAE